MSVTVPTADEFAALAQGVSTLSERVEGMAAAAPSTPSAAPAYGLWLDSFPGASDDARLDAALAQVKADTVSRPILLANRKHTFAKARTLVSGIKLVNPFGFGNQQRAANSIPCHINFTGSGTWWTLGEKSVFDVQFSGFGATSTTGKATFLAGGTNVLWTSLLRDLGFLNWYGVLGNRESRLQVTAVAADGWLNINNARGVSIHVGGSDCAFSWTRALIDTDSGMVAADPHVWLDWLENSTVAGLYVTAEAVVGVRVDGSANASGNGGAVFLRDCVIEGRNAGAPSARPMQVGGGRCTMLGCQVDYPKTGPHIAMTGGVLTVIGCHFLPANGWKTGPVVTRAGSASAELIGCTAPWGTPTIG